MPLMTSKYSYTEITNPCNLWTLHSSDLRHYANILLISIYDIKIWTLTFYYFKLVIFYCK